MTLARSTLTMLLAALRSPLRRAEGRLGERSLGSIAVVDGTEISKEDLDELVAQAKKGYESQKHIHPSGDPRVPDIQTQYVAYLWSSSSSARQPTSSDCRCGRRHRMRRSRADQEPLRRQRAEYEKALEAQASPRSSTARRRSRSLRSREDLRRGHQRREGERRRRSSSTTPRTKVRYGTPESRDVLHFLSRRRAATARSTLRRARKRRTTSTRSSKMARTSLRLRRRARPTQGASDSGASSRSRAGKLSGVRQGVVRAGQGELSQPVKTGVRLPRHRGRVETRRRRRRQSRRFGQRSARRSSSRSATTRCRPGSRI